jgi:integrase
VVRQGFETARASVSSGGHSSSYWCQQRQLASSLSDLDGQRLSELAEADTRDIVTKEGVWVMEIKKTMRIPDQRRKTKVSSRDAPLHSALLAEGFLDYRDGIIREYGNGPLFPQIGLDAYGRRNGNVSKPISKWLRNVVGITNPRTPFHSHRHTATSSCGTPACRMARPPSKRMWNDICSAIRKRIPTPVMESNGSRP